MIRSIEKTEINVYGKQILFNKWSKTVHEWEIQNSSLSIAYDNMNRASPSDVIWH